MAVLPGWKRLPGTSRNYVNTLTGAVLPRRQYEKLVTAAAARRSEPAPRRARVSKMQSQYNAMLESYVRSQRAQGNRINKKQARESAEFKRAVRMVRTKRRIGETDMQRQARQEARRMGLAQLGGEEFFRRVYDQQLAQQMEDEEQDEELDEAA